MYMYTILVDLFEWRTRNTTRVENNNMGLFVNRHYKSTWFEVKYHGNYNQLQKELTHSGRKPHILQIQYVTHQIPPLPLFKVV